MYKKPIVKVGFLSDVAFDFLRRLLKIDRGKQLDAGLNDSEEIKYRKFFKGINWNDVCEKKYKPRLFRT